MTLLSKKILPITLVLAGSIALAACSSKPSPWSESSSPWEGRAEQNVEPEPLAVDDVESVAMFEPETIEPAGVIASEEDAMMMEGAAEMEPLEEPMGDVEPMAEPVAVGGGLAEQPAGMFAVQVVASSSMEQLTAFANANQLSDEWVAETIVDGKVWFVLMSGVYATKSEAEQALEGLQGLETQPWIRSVGSVQSAMSQ